MSAIEPLLCLTLLLQLYTDVALYSAHKACLISCDACWSTHT